MDSDEMAADWFGYEREPGVILFYHNSKTGELRWPAGFEVGIQ